MNSRLARFWKREKPVRHPDSALRAAYPGGDQQELIAEILVSLGSGAPIDTLRLSVAGKPETFSAVVTNIIGIQLQTFTAALSGHFTPGLNKLGINTLDVTVPTQRPRGLRVIAHELSEDRRQAVPARAGRGSAG